MRRPVNLTPRPNPSRRAKNPPLSLRTKHKVVRVQLKAITPKYIPQSKEYRRAIEAAVRKSANLVKRDYESTVRTFSPENKPDFEVTVDESGGNFTITAGTD